MKIVFVYGAYENIGIEYLSSCLGQEGHETDLVFDHMIFADSLVDNDFLGNLFKDNLIAQKVKDKKPDLIAFSLVTDHFRHFEKIAREIRKIVPVPIIAGGVHPTGAPQTVLEESPFDFICVGEGEIALTKLANMLESMKKRGIKLFENQEVNSFAPRFISPKAWAEIEKIPGIWFRKWARKTGFSHEKMAFQGEIEGKYRREFDHQATIFQEEIEGKYRREFDHQATIFQGGFGELVQDLDTLPFPHKDLFFKDYPWLGSTWTIMTSRGCPYRCSFCINDTWDDLYGDKKFYRRRSVESVIRELKWAKSNYPIKSIMFEDDVFTKDKDWVLKLCKLYKKEIDLPFVCVLHPLDCDLRVLYALKKANCIQIEIGVQTLNQRIRREKLNRFERNKDIRKALFALHKSGIPFNIDHIVGLPGDENKWHIRSLKLYNQVRPNRILLFFITCYPGTQIGQKCVDGGICDEIDVKQASFGLGQSDEGTGTVNRKLAGELEVFRFIFGWLPLLPRNIVNCLLKNNRFMVLPRNRWMSKIIPSVLAIFSGAEPRGQVIMIRYMMNILARLPRKAL